MLDSDLAELYQVPTKVLNQAVRRNSERFPKDFMFQLTKKEAASLRSHFVTSKETRGGRRYMPLAFTEQGVAMLSSVLSSSRAIRMNILIVRAFVKLRQVLATHKDLALRLDEMEAAQRQQGSILVAVVEEIKKIRQGPRRAKRKIGFYTAESSGV